ncbi:uncharacterized protein LOC112602113 [Melanaphis sacchari]|uniref:uncharacterized protein LOC112602113 n=1 Tax=Melanaphis sacchari TaxID=742174 RepID=UPI000DC140D1|nr:uncharacterized protein LOC112602113 [Melanaphis sacchari]
MWSKLNSEEKNIFCNRGEHSKNDTKPVTLTNNDQICTKSCSVYVGPPINMDRLKEYARKPPKEPTFGLNQRYPKRTKNEDLQEGLSQYIGPFDFEHLTSKPRVILDFLRVPSMSKLTMLLDLMYNDSLHRLCSNDLRGRERKDEIMRLRLYHKGTTIRKTFMELVNDYKRMKRTNTLNFSQISDLRHAYENILEPGEYLNKVNDDFDLSLDDSGIKIENMLNEFCMVPSFTDFLSTTIIANDKNKTEKLPQDLIDWVKEVRSRDSLILNDENDSTKTTEDKLKNVSIDVVEKEVNLKCNSNDDDNIENEKETPSHCLEKVKTSTDSLEQERNSTINQDMEISIDSVAEKSVTNYQDVEASESKVKEIPMVILEQETSIDVLKDETFTKKSEEEEVEEEDKKREEVEKEEKEGEENDEEGGEREETAINTLEENNISSNYSKINKIFKKKLLTHSLRITKAEKRTLVRIINSKFDPDKINWKRYKPSTRTRLFQVIVYFGSFRMALCDELHLDRLGLKNDKICEIDKLLRSIKVETGLLQQFFTFNGIENILIWPLGKDIVNIIIPESSPTINILFSFVRDIITKFCEKLKVLLRKSGLKIVLNKESLFENLPNYQIGKDVCNTELSLDYANVHTQSSSKKLNTEHLDLTKTSFCIKKNSSNEKICQSMINIIKSDDSIFQSWNECNNLNKFKSKLLQAGVTLPIEESNTLHCSKFVEIYVRWFCEEYLQGEKFYKLALSILKNIILHINTVGECTDTKVETAINNVLIILYHDPCFAKVYELYVNAKNPKCSSSSKHENFSDEKYNSDYVDVNKKAIGKVNIESNVNVQTNMIETNNVEMPSNNSGISTSCVFGKLNDVLVNDSEVTSNPQCSNYNSKNDFIYDFSNLLSENNDGSSNTLFENVDVDENNFNEANPFDDFPMTNLFDDNIPLENHSVNDMLGINLQFQQDKNTEEVSLISSCDQLVNYAVSDEISLEELNMAAVSDEYGFDNAGVLLPPYN